MLTATESGWPPRSSSATTVRVAMFTTTSLPVGATKEAEVFTATRAYAPATATEVGSPSSASDPRPTGADGSVMSTKPISFLGLFV